MKTFNDYEELRNEVIRRAKLMLKIRGIDTVCTNHVNGVEWHRFIRQATRNEQGLIEISDDLIAEQARSVRNDTIYWECS